MVGSGCEMKLEVEYDFFNNLGPLSIGETPLKFW
jgi:hypothetical protein